MNTKAIAVLLAGTVISISGIEARADDDHDSPPVPSNATFTTRALTPFAIEGLTGDAAGKLYTTGRQPDGNKKCPVWKIDPADGSRVTVAFIPNRAVAPPPPAPAASTPCNPSGITFDGIGNLYIADAATIEGVAGFVWKVTPHPSGCKPDDSSDPACESVPTADAFASGTPGTNGLAFDRDGNLWTGDGVTGQGRVWRIDASGGAVCEPASASTRCKEVFRIQPMANAAGAGRQASTLQPPQTPTASPNPQPLVANGLAFNRAGDLYIADTARGAIWKAELDRGGNLQSETGCDATFAPNTLCLNSISVAHPYLEGTDGIALDRAGNIWNSANERNAIVVVTAQGGVLEVFRNPVIAGLRNGGPLELPTSPFLSDKRFCTANSDGNRRDNSPNTAGEIKPAGPDRGKISCMDQELAIPGLPLPVR